LAGMVRDNIMDNGRRDVRRADKLQSHHSSNPYEWGADGQVNWLSTASSTVAIIEYAEPWKTTTRQRWEEEAARLARAEISDREVTRIHGLTHLCTLRVLDILAGFLVLVLPHDYGGLFESVYVLHLTQKLSPNSLNSIVLRRSLCPLSNRNFPFHMHTTLS
jgi:hypothetical protein